MFRQYLQCFSIFNSFNLITTPTRREIVSSSPFSEEMLNNSLINLASKTYTLWSQICFLVPSVISTPTQTEVKMIPLLAQQHHRWHFFHITLHCLWGSEMEAEMERKSSEWLLPGPFWWGTMVLSSFYPRAQWSLFFLSPVPICVSSAPSPLRL